MSSPEPMIVYCGASRNTTVERHVRILACGAGEIDCLECGGSGWWAFMEPEIPGAPCIDCKGVGKVLVSAP